MGVLSEPHLTYGTEGEVVEAIEINQDTNFKDKFINGCYDYFRCIKYNYKDILCLCCFIICILGYFATIFTFYILGSVYPEKWTFLCSNVANGFYIFFMIFSIVCHSSFWVNILNRHKNKIRVKWLVLVWLLLTTSFCLVPFLISDMLIKSRYENLCDDYLYDIIVYKNSLEYYLDDNLILKSMYSYDTKKLTIKTNNLIGTTLNVSIVLDEDGYSNGFSVSYDSKLIIGDSSSTSSSWYNNPMKMVGDMDVLTGENPFDPNECKMCINNYDIELLKSALIFPLQKRMNTCRKCMEPCTSECTNWSTRLIPITSCDSKGRCHTTYITQTYCSQHRSYSQCLNTRCRYPACIGIKM